MGPHPLGHITTPLQVEVLGHLLPRELIECDISILDLSQYHAIPRHLPRPGIACQEALQYLHLARQAPCVVTFGIGSFQFAARLKAQGL
jgi:hypothetical protein